MKDIELQTLEILLHELLLEKAKMEYNNSYVFGSDNVFRILISKIDKIKYD